MSRSRYCPEVLSNWEDAELEMYTFLFPLDTRHPNPPQLGPSDSPVGISEIDFAGVGARAIGCISLIPADKCTARSADCSNRTAIARNVHDTSTLGIRLGPIHRNLSKDERPCSSCLSDLNPPTLFGSVSSNRGLITWTAKANHLWSNRFVGQRNSIDSGSPGGPRRRTKTPFINVHLHLIPQTHSTSSIAP
jgi:hypothetical protein